MTFYRIGEWVSAEVTPKNDENKTYIVSYLFDNRRLFDENSHKMIGNEIYRYCNDRWEYWSRGWFVNENHNFKVAAYATAETLEPYNPYTVQEKRLTESEGAANE